MQEISMTDEQIDMEEVAEMQLDKSVSKMKAAQSRKRMTMFKQLESNLSNENTSRNSTANQATKNQDNGQRFSKNSGNSTLGILYLVSVSIFVLLSAALAIKLWLRLIYKEFGHYSIEGQL